MARWGKGRGTSLAVPLDNLFKENINCPSVARSAGVVGKWGITSFTSLRSAPYAFSSQYVKSQVQDQNSPLTVPVPTTADEAPKPKKFFKSRNTVPDAPPEGSQAGAVSSAPEPPKASTLFHRRDDKPKSAGAKKASKASVKEIPPDKEDIPKLKIHIDKSKNSKKAFATKASKKEDTTMAEVAHLSPNKRYLVRNRNKIINYSEDRSNSPLLPEEIALLTRESPPKTVPPLKVSPPKISPPLSSPTYVKPGLMSPTNKEGKPPIVLRISKGTSRLLSTDSEDVLASPNSDRHSISEPHFDEKPSPVPVIGSPPKQEGIKITIKLDTKSKKHEKEDKPSRSMRASKRSHHKTNEEKAEIEEKMARVGSPVPGSDNYELYRTLASPVRADVANQTKNEEPELGDVETALENLHAVAEPPIPKLIIKDSNANLSSKIDTSPPPEPKPPERRTGRTMRNRLNVNYNEDNNFLDEVTTLRHSKNAAKIFSKKSKRKEERNHEIASSATAETIDSKSDDELLQTLSEGSEPIRLNNEATASKRSHKKSSQSPMSDDNEPLVLKISHKKFNQSPRSEDNKALILRKSHKKSSQSPRSEDNEPLILKKSHKKSSQSPQSEDNEPLILKKTHKKSPRNEDNEPLILRKSHRKSSPRRSPSDDNEPLALKKSRKTLDQSPPSDDNEPLVLKKTHKKSSQSPQSEDNAELPENRIQSPRRSERQARSPEKIVFKSPKRICESGNSDNDEKPSVKLVIMKKKGSIFKTRAPVNEGGPMAAVKKRQLYKHKWADDGKGGQTPRREPEAEAAAAAEAEAAAAAPGAPGAEAAEAPLARVTRFRPEADFGDDAPDPYTSVRCHRGAKEYYTVVRNVKKAHQIQEIGEFQEFNDDVEYILDALQDNNPMATRCLSAITLASKCTAPAFRMHVRAHGTVQKFFRALHDATNDQSLGLCTATVMFVLSQDRLNMDLDRESLELMLNLLESDVSHKNALDDCGLTLAQLDKNKERVRELCAEIKNEGKAKHLDLENITVGNLAMETLLSLTSKRAGEWFKEELRSLGGIDHIVRTIRDCCAAVGFQRERPAPVAWAPHLLDTLRKADRCMKVLENVTQQNEENQMYLVRSGGDSQCVATLARLYCACLREARRRPEPPVLAALTDTLLPTLKVLVNLSHSFSSNREVIGSGVVGEQPGVFNTSIALLTEGHKIIPDDLDFEFSVCVLLLLINLVQNNTSNVQRLLETVYTEQDDADSKKPIIEALIDQFYKREELARLAEQNTNDILDGEKEDEPKEKKMSHDDIIEETVAKLLQKAGVHMEHTMVGSYIVLLLGHIASTGEELELKVRQMLPTHGFEQMRATLTKYSSFLNLTASGEASSVAHIKATQKIMDFLNRSDKLHDDLQSQDQVSSSSNLNETQSPASHLSPDRLNCSAASNNPPSEYNTTSDSDRMSTSMDLDTSFS